MSSRRSALLAEEQAGLGRPAKGETVLENQGINRCLDPRCPAGAGRAGVITCCLASYGGGFLPDCPAVAAFPDDGLPLTSLVV